MGKSRRSIAERPSKAIGDKPNKIRHKEGAEGVVNVAKS